MAGSTRFPGHTPKEPPLQHPPATGPDQTASHPPGPADHRGLLDRLDGLVELAAERRGLALLPDGRLAAAEERAAAHAAGLRPSADDDLGALGLLRARGGRLEATALRPAWGRVDPGLRAGLVYAAWCQQVALTGWPTCMTPSSWMLRSHAVGSV